MQAPTEKLNDPSVVKVVGDFRAYTLPRPKLPALFVQLDEFLPTGALFIRSLGEFLQRLGRGRQDSKDFDRGYANL